MKKTYQTPETEIIVFVAEDVITDSIIDPEGTPM